MESQLLTFLTAMMLELAHYSDAGSLEHRNTCVKRQKRVAEESIIKKKISTIKQQRENAIKLPVTWASIPGSSHWGVPQSSHLLHLFQARPKSLIFLEQTLGNGESVGQSEVPNKDHVLFHR